VHGLVPSRYLSSTLRDTTTSGPPPSEPARRRRSRRLRQVVIGLSILIVAFAVFASRQGGDGDGGGPLNAIAAAAEKTQQEPGGRALMHAVVTTPEQRAPLMIAGQMVYDAKGRTQAVITVPRSETGDSVKMESVSDGTVMYMRSSEFDSLPDGAEWMALDFSFGDDLDTPVPTDVDAKGELALLEAVGDDVRKLGKEDVRGVSTTHYRGTISVSDQVERLREEGADDLASLSEKEGAPLRVEAWIDAEGLVRRMRLVHAEPSEDGDGSKTMDMRMDFIDFGIEPEIDVPDSSEVFDATAMAREKLGLSNDD
jgi:hypothetical protein